MKRLFFALLLLTTCATHAHAELGKAAVQEKKLYENVYAVCIGVDGQSRDDLVPPLRFAGNDAKAVHEVFTTRYGYDSQLLTGPDANRANILKAIRFAAGGAAEHDVLIVYFAGHGQTVTPAGAAPHEKVGYLIAYDTEVDFTQPVTDVKTVDAQAVPMRDVVKLVSDSKAAHVLLILDCCFSGFAADLEVGSRAISPGERQALSDLLGEPTRQVFTAGTSDQKSLEFKELEHGLFTYYLVEELNTTPNDIYSLVEAFAAVRGKVSAAAAKGNGRMTPQLRQLRPSNGDWVFIDKEVAEDALTRYETKPRTQTTTDEYETFTATARSAETAKGGEGSLQNDPEYAAKHEEYQARADMGDPVAMAIVSEMAAHGWGVQKDEGKAFAWASEANRYDATTEQRVGAQLLGFFYDHGIGVEKNPAMGQSVRQQAGASLMQAGVASLTGNSLSTEQKVGTGLAVVQNLPALFGSGAKATDIGKHRAELRDAAVKADAKKVDDRLKKLEKAVADLAAQAANADGKLDPAFANKLGEFHAQLAPPLKAARKWEALGAFHKIEDELKQMDPAITQINQMFGK